MRQHRLRAPVADAVEVFFTLEQGARLTLYAGRTKRPAASNHGAFNPKPVALGRIA